MDRKVVIKKFKRQIQSLWLLKFENWADPKFTQWSILTKLYLIHVFQDKKNDYLRGMYVSMFDDAIKLMPIKKWTTQSEEDLASEVRFAKNWLQATLKAFIEMLEVDQPYINWWSQKTKISIENTQFNNQKVNINHVIKNIMSEISKEYKDKPEIIKEAEGKTQQLESELKKTPSESNRHTVKDIIKWFADLGKDVLIAALPAILKYYWVAE